jgi:phosphate transport system substrate-binding protein
MTKKPEEPANHVVGRVVVLTLKEVMRMQADMSKIPKIPKIPKAIKRQLPSLAVLAAFLAVCVALFFIVLRATDYLGLAIGLSLCLVFLGCAILPAIHTAQQGFTGYPTVVVPLLFTLIPSMAFGTFDQYGISLSFLYQELALFLFFFFPLAVFGQGLGMLVRLVLARRHHSKAPDVLGGPVVDGADGIGGIGGTGGLPNSPDSPGAFAVGGIGGAGGEGGVAPVLAGGDDGGALGAETGRKKRSRKALGAPVFVCSACLASLLVWMIGVPQAVSSAARAMYVEEALASNNGMVADRIAGEPFKAYPRGENWQQIVFDSPFQLGKSVREPGADSYRQSYGTYPHIDGSTVCIPLAAEFAYQHLGVAEEEIGAYTMFNTTDAAYDYLISRKPSWPGTYLIHWADPVSGEVAARDDAEGYCRLAPAPTDLFLGTEPSKDELALAASSGVELIKKPICYDAFVFITHKDNPVQSLTLEQVRAIYTGSITNWKEVGGNDEAIMAFQRQQNSGSQTAMENLVMEGVPMADPVTVKVVWVMTSLVDEVAAYHNGSSSIGYTYKAFIEMMYPDEDIKTIAIEGVSPSAANVANGTYPLSTSYYGVVRAKDVERTGGRFFEWIRSDEGQRCVAQAGYIPLAPRDRGEPR